MKYPSKEVSNKFYIKFSSTYDDFRKHKGIDVIRCKRYTDNYVCHTRAYIKSIFKEDVEYCNKHNISNKDKAIECFHNMATKCKAQLKTVTAMDVARNASCNAASKAFLFSSSTAFLVSTFVFFFSLTKINLLNYYSFTFVHSFTTRTL